MSIALQVAETAALVVEQTLRRPATLGGGRLVCVDGPAGSGKTTLGHAVCTAATDHGTSGLIHLDDLLDGWDGLAGVAATLRDGVLAPLLEGRPGHYRRYDWHAARFAEEHRVDPVDLLVVEGVGAGDSSYAAAITTLVWVEAPEDLRLERGIARDGEALRGQWLRWLAAERALHRREHTRQRADVVVDGTGTLAPSVRRR